jgi:hypothetical protein
MWPLWQCKDDIERHRIKKPIVTWEEQQKTNQQATADHTAKMFNQSRTQHQSWDGNPANKPKENKMTRKEAIGIANEFQNSSNNEGLIDALEALGLIKFDEESKLTPLDILNGYTVHVAAIIESLDKHGYKIVKK